MKKVLLLCLLLAFQSWVSAQTTPTIVSQSSSQAVPPGTSITLSVTATADDQEDYPLSYNWVFNGDWFDSTTNTYTIPYFRGSDCGTYSVIVDNGLGDTTSADIVLSIGGGGCASASSGLTAWWQGENNGLDYAGGNDGNVKSAVTYTNGVVGKAFAFNGTTNSVIGLGTTLGNFKTNDLTIQLWAKFDDVNDSAIFLEKETANSDNPNWEFGIVAGMAYAWQQGTTTISGSALTDLDILVGNTQIFDNGWHHMAWVRSGLTNYLYVDGLLDAYDVIGDDTPLNVNNTGTLRIGQDINAGFVSGNYVGALDEITIHNRALSSNEIYAVFAAGTNGMCCADVNITTQPTSPKKIQASSNAVFTVASLGTGLSYQWYHASTKLTNGLTGWGSTVSGATNPSLTITHPLSASDLGSYTVVVSNKCNVVTSDEAYLDFSPVITSQPHSCTASIGQAYTNFSVSASGTALTYKWRSNGGVFLNNPAKYGSSTNTPTLTIYNIQGTDADTYSVVITNHGGTVTSSSVFLSTAPEITTQPADKTNSCGTSVTFTIAATGTPTLTYRWQSNTVSNPTFTDIAGATTKNLTVSGILANWTSNAYRCIVGNPIGSTTSSVAHLYVRATVSNSPASTHTCDGNPITLAVTPYNTDINSYQWRRNGTAISGATLSTYTTATTGSYTVVIGNAYGTDTSSPAAILSAFSSPVITVSPQTQTVSLGNPAWLSGYATGTLPITYAWIKNGSETAASGITNFVIGSVVATNAGSYVFQAANDCNTVNSSAAVLTITNPVCASNLVDSSLIDWWKFESNVVDSISNYDGTANGLTYATGKVGTGIVFDGTTNATLTFGTNAANFGANDFTIEFWMNTTSTRMMTFMDKRPGPGCGFFGSGWDVRISGGWGVNGLVTFECWAGGIKYGGTEKTRPVCDGAWHHIAVTRSNLVVSLYIDGVNMPDATITMSSSLNLSNNEQFQMGRTYCESMDEYPFMGGLDEVSIYNRALTPSEIQAAFDASYEGKSCP